MTKIIWKVSPEPTGRYRSFQKRDWPDASYEDGKHAGSIECDEEYCPADIKAGKTFELRLSFADYSEGSESLGAWKRKTFKKRFSTIGECKKFLKEYFVAKPEVMPEKYRPGLNKWEIDTIITYK